MELPVAHLQAGSRIGFSRWLPIPQEMITRFGELTLDPDPMHVDPEWARTNGPYGGTIAFGFLTMALLSHMLHDAIATNPVAALRGAGHYLNYGFDRLRLVEPVPAGARIRGGFGVRLTRLDARGRVFTTFDTAVEIEGLERPAMVAEWITLWVPEGVA